MYNDDLDMIYIQKAAEVVRAYCPPDRRHAYRQCENRGSLSHCLDCWIEWFDDAAKMKGD